MAAIYQEAVSLDSKLEMITIGFIIGKIKQPIKSYVMPKLNSKFPPQLQNDLITLKNSIVNGNVQ